MHSTRPRAALPAKSTLPVAAPAYTVSRPVPHATTIEEHAP
ncbi:hypothetical protein [Streptomyces sp. NPDC003832]